MFKKDEAVSGNVAVQLMPDNIVVTFLDMKGKVVTWSSTLAQGFKGEWRISSQAAKKTAAAAAKKAAYAGMFEVNIYIKNDYGDEMDMVIKAIIEGILSAGIKIQMVYDKHGVRIRHDRENKPDKGDIFVLEKYIERLKEWWRMLWW
ncbi:MAG: 30S ribosomal protein S11 [Nitrospirae bacterium]|nr:30S ribosomal protein S11 [Nitrospirota bacterium]